VEPLTRDLTDDADAQPRPRERLPRHDRLGQTQLTPDSPHLVLEEGAQGLDELELQVIRQAAHVVVALDVGGAAAPTTLDDVGVEGALHEKPNRLTRISRLRNE